MRRYIFRVAAAVAMSFAALCASAGNPATERAARRLDMREHEGYVGFERLIPTHVKLQYAGGMGVVSLGAGWDYGRRCRWETDVMVGFLPRAYADRFHMTLTLRQNYIPWSIRCGGASRSNRSPAAYISISYRANVSGCANLPVTRARVITDSPRGCAYICMSGSVSR